MTTNSNCSPDYKSEKRSTAPWDVEGFTDGSTVIINGKPDTRADHMRLRDAVVEAAKSLRQAMLYPTADWPIEREMENFNRDIDALIEFESKHS